MIMGGYWREVETEKKEIALGEFPTLQSFRSEGSPQFASEGLVPSVFLAWKNKGQNLGQPQLLESEGEILERRNPKRETLNSVYKLQANSVELIAY